MHRNDTMDQTAKDAVIDAENIDTTTQITDISPIIKNIYFKPAKRLVATNKRPLKIMSNTRIHRNPKAQTPK